MASLQKNVAGQNFTFALVNASTGAALTLATVTVKVTKDNGAQAGGAGTVTEAGNGQYNYAPTQAETNATDVGFLLTAASAIPVNIDFHPDQVDANGLVKVDVEDWKSAAVSSPAASGVPDVNVKNVNNVAATSVTAVNANIGTTQPVNFTGTGASALVKGDAVDIAGAAVSTSSAQIGVNVVQYNGQTAQTDANNLPKVDVEDVGGAALATHAAGMVPADLRDIAGAAVSAASAQLGVNVVNIAGQAATLDGNNLLKVDVADWNGTAVAALPANFFSLAIDASGNVSLTSNLKKNTALAGFTFTMTDSTSHNPRTGLSVTAQRSLNGGAFGACANGVTEIANGNYAINLAASDLNANVVMLRLTAAGADDLNLLLITQP
jgi:hypothetical protein